MAKSKLNLQQLPKDSRFLRCFTAAPGHVLVYTDISALEPHVLAQASKDPGLMGLYGPDAKPNDAYLFYAAQTQKYGEKILKYYDPFNPTQESVDLAKEKCAAERDEFKPIYLGKIYGLGPETMQETTSIPYEECKQILKDIEEAQPGVRAFNERLLEEWKSNGGWVKQEWLQDPDTGKWKSKLIDGRPGWVYNGRYRPIGVAPEKVKDLNNRYVQSTGHDVLLQLLVYINQMRIPTMRPYNVDMHDATIWQVRAEAGDRAADVISEAYDRLNDTIQWDVKIKGAVKLGNTLADFLD